MLSAYALVAKALHVGESEGDAVYTAIGRSRVAKLRARRKRAVKG